MSRFIFVQPHLRLGGAERQTVIVANALAARGHDVQVVLFGDDGGFTQDLDARVGLHLLGLESHLMTVEVARRLTKVLAALPPALVVVKLWSAILTCALVDRRRSGAPHTFVYCEDLDPAAHHAFIRLGRTKRRVVGAVFRSRRYVVANSRSVADRMVRVHGLSRRPAITPVVVATDATGDARSFDGLDEPQADARAEVVSVGSLVPLKGLDVTLAALRSLDRPVRWTVVGEGPLAAELGAFSDPRGLLEVQLTGGVRDPRPFLRGADLLVHSSRSEAWGAVILEALAAGTPVVASDTIGPVEMRAVLGTRPELLELYPVGDSRALARVLSDRLSVRPAREECAQYVAPFSVDTAVADWEQRAIEWAGVDR